MTEVAFDEALAAARALLDDAALEPVEDSFDRVVFARGVPSPSTVLRSAAGAIVRAGSVILEWERDEIRLTLHSRSEGTWSVDGDLAAALPRLKDAQAKSQWTTDELLGDGGARELDAVEEARVRVELDKARWSEPIGAATGRSVWIGPTTAGFSRWLAEATVKAAVGRLFAGDGRAGALVLLADWQGDAVRAGDRLVLGGLKTRDGQPADRPKLVDRLRERGELDNLPFWRAIDVDLEGVPDPVRGPLSRVVGMTAARLVAEGETDGRLRPSVDEATLWPRMPDPPGPDAVGADAVVMLARWLADDLSQARIDVARHVAAVTLDDPLNGGDGAQLVDTARVTYHLVVHKDVLTSLEHQQKLEESFHALDEKAQEMRLRLGDTLDATLTKVLGAALAIAIAALASPRVRDLPATLASIALAGYLLWSAYTLWYWFKQDAETRLDAARAVAAGRMRGVGADLESTIATWKSELARRARSTAIALCVLAVAIVAGGLVANADFRHATGLAPDTIAPRLAP